MIKAYIAISILLASIFCLYILKGISFAGQLSDKILFWTWLLMTVIIVVRFIKKRWVKWYVSIIGFLIILSLIPMGTPFLMLTNFTLDINGDYEVRIENYRLREEKQGIYSSPIIKVIKNIGVFEIEIDEMDFGECAGEYDTLSNVNEINVLEEDNNVFFVFKIRDFHCKRKLGNYRTMNLL
ncbi:hypothetical protein [Aquimarina sp. SS2-1]|uniref:hypothetical protein n=1 Tax=Aquimarina besae TaxID=3342247 RepID=UPI00366C99D9